MGLFQCSTFFLAFMISISAITTSKGSPSVIDASGQSISRGVHNGVAFANFKAHKFSYLNITSIGTDFVLNRKECGVGCANIPSCFSFNLAAFYDINGRILCELLPSDKYNNSDKFVSSQSFHHFSIASSCMSAPCQNGGSCVSIYEENSYQCICVKGYTGSVCQTDIDDCASNPCKNNGTCTDRANGFNCSCTPAFYGTQCETDVDECSVSIPLCDVNAHCKNTLGTYRCTCKAGFTGDGKTCTDVDECSASVPVCDVNADCMNTRGSYRCTCKAGCIGDGKTCIVIKHCAELYKSGIQKSGVYLINPDGLGAFDVFCDQTTAGGGWTVFQKRMNGSVDFYRDWADYKRGFGNLSGEFWLGLDKIHRLTSSGEYKLRVDLEDFAGNTVYAEYHSFEVNSEGTKYRLSIGNYSGTAGDSLAYHNGYPFSTKDQDNDSYDGNCAVRWKGAWWYRDCHASNLNGIYHHGRYMGADGVRWYHWKQDSAKRAEMKIRPMNY